MKRSIIYSFSAILLVIISLPALAQNSEMFYKAAGSPANPKVQVSWNKYNTNPGNCRYLHTAG